jgi:hypothetical protein
VSLTAALLALAAGATPTGAGRGSGGEMRVVAVLAAEPGADGLSPAQEAEVERAIAARGPWRGAPPKAADAGSFPFFPQAGGLGRDLFLNNFTDLDPAAGIRDWDCSQYTYDGHQGHDALIRSFREQEIGVPVFAVRPGLVVQAHDGEPDHNTEWVPTNHANLVVLDHGDGLTTWYLHFAAGSVRVAVGDVVAAGAQLGSTGSSGISDWPHLHFETRRSGVWLEPSAGPCHEGDSLWSAQPVVEREARIVDFALRRGPSEVRTYEEFLRDEAPRAGSFLRGRQTVGLRGDLRAVPGGAPFRVRVYDPKKRVALDRTGLHGHQDQRLAVALIDLDLDLATVGLWRLVAELDGGPLVDAPFRVVASASQLGNRKPNRVTARLAPAQVEPGRVMTCTVDTSPVNEDPDFDVVAYRYEWRAGSRLLRQATSAGLSDRLAADVAAPGEKVTCKVTPTDGKSSGPTAVAKAGGAS